MIQVVFGWLGFHWNGGKVKGFRFEDRDAFVLCIFVGVFGIIVWNFEGMQMWMRVLRLSVDDAALVARADEEIHKRVVERSEKQIAEFKEMYERFKDEGEERYYSTQKLLSEANTRCRDLETTVKVLTGYSKLPTGL